ncbi:MAG: GtrA family protein [Thermoproteota archaeon]|nr:GtrA family protein [Thermoproteota archaeon]
MKKEIANIIKNETFSQAIKYSVVGGFCTVLDFAILFLLTHSLDLNYLLSSIISFTFGTILNYYLCTFWVFKIRIIEERHREFFYYAGITGVGLVINTLLIYSFTEFFNLYFMHSKIIATFVTFWWNFGARKYFLHTIKRTW